MSAGTWSAELGDAAQQQVRALLERARRADGVAAVGDDVLRALGRSSAHLLLAGEGAGVGLVGYANLDARGDTPVGELAVGPGHRRHGHGRALLADVLDRGGDDTRVWAHGDTDGARALAATAGLEGVRDLLQLRLDLRATALPATPVRDDVAVRTYAGGQDDAALLAVNNAAFAWHPEQGGWGQDEIDQRRGEAWFDPAGLFLAHDAGAGGGADEQGALLGFHWTKVHAATGTGDGDAPAVGEVYVVGISPDAQGRGLGKLLTLTGLHHLRDAGLDAVVLYVEGDNTAALHTYEGLGFTRFHLDRAYARSVR